MPKPSAQRTIRYADDLDLPQNLGVPSSFEVVIWQRQEYIFSFCHLLYKTCSLRRDTDVGEDLNPFSALVKELPVFNIKSEEQDSTEVPLSKWYHLPSRSFH